MQVGENARKQKGAARLHAVERMDDGTRIEMHVDIDTDTVSDADLYKLLTVTFYCVQGGARVDFSGTGREVYGSTNAPPAVTLAAVIYALRCLVGRDIPLNQGCLEPVEVHIPKGAHYADLFMQNSSCGVL